MPANVDALVQEGIASFKAGNRSAARQALMKAVELDERNEQAWLWLAGAVDSLDERVLCLENVLQLNPANAKAQKGLESTRRELAARAPAPPPPSSGAASPFGGAAPLPNDPFGGAFGTGFETSPGAGYDTGFGGALASTSGAGAFGNIPATPAPPSSPFAGTGFDSNPYKGSDGPANDPAMSGWAGVDTSFGAGVGSGVWGPPPSRPVTPPPPSSAGNWGTLSAPAIPSAQEYDSWMQGLSLPGTGTPASKAAPVFNDPFNSADPFASSDPFGMSSAASASSGFADAGWGTFDASPAPATNPTPASFDTPLFGGAPTPEPYITPNTPERSPYENFNFDAVPTSSDVEDPFNFGTLKSGGSSVDFGTVETARKPALTPIGDAEEPEPAPQEGSPFDMLESFPLPQFKDDEESGAVAAADPIERVNSFNVPVPDPNVLRKSTGKPTSDRLATVSPSGASVFTTIDSSVNLVNPSIYFQQIPDEIQEVGPVSSMIRTPKRAGDRPVLLILTVVVLLIANLGSIALLIANLPR